MGLRPKVPHRIIAVPGAFAGIARARLGRDIDIAMKSNAARRPFATWLRLLLSTGVRILLRGSPLGRFRLFAAWMRIQVKNKLLAEIAGRDIRSEKVLGQTLHFFDYSAFAIVFEEVYVGGAYEFRAANREPFLIDAGANIGVSIAFFKTLYPDCRILAFEPDAENFRLLEENARANGWTRTELHATGLHRRDGELPFYIYNDSPGALSSGFWQLRSAGEASRVTALRTEPLSRYVGEFVDLLKLDVEGSEHAILEDLAESGALARIGRIVCEYHHHVQPGDDRLGKFLSTLESAGFGYHLLAPLAMPFPEDEFQTFTISAYRRSRTP